MNMGLDEVILGALIIGGVVLGLVAIVGGLMHARRGRLLEHAERMKALELGRELPGKEMARVASAEKAEPGPKGEKSLAVQCYSTTGYVCGSGFVFAWMAGTANPGVGYAIAAAVGAVGVTGMICGTVLASKATAGPSYSMATSKPPRFDPEAV